MKKFCCFLLLLVCSFSCLSCVKKEESEEQTESTAVELSKKELEVEILYYNNAKELCEKADLVIRGKVDSISQEVKDTGLSQDFPYTIYHITVSKVYKGAAASGEAFQLQTFGGILDNVKYSLLGDPLSIIEEGKEYLFICHIPKDSRYISLLNPYQGVFDINDPKEVEFGISLEEVLKVFGLSSKHSFFPEDSEEAKLVREYAGK